MNINEKRKDETRQEIHEVVSELRTLIRTLYIESHEQLFKLDTSINDAELTFRALTNILDDSLDLSKNLSRAKAKIDFLYLYCQKCDSINKRIKNNE